MIVILHVFSRKFRCHFDSC
ncbi:hypothetical protein C4F50_15900 [Flavobacterium sp. KB82]|uniref:Uncharacterized protein n=1 Tax=Flavobacterium hungaricum TaxID=2082725 RepID=A0ABR9TM32_9FLAO|nr:hypothetical protein [Flavobacterium hungaricum]